MTERGRRFIRFLLPVAVLGIAIGVAAVLWLHAYWQTAYDHVSKFCQVLLEREPEAAPQVLSALKEFQTLPEGEIGGNSFLAQYGYGQNSFCQGMEGQYGAAACLVFCLALSGFLLWGWWENRRVRRRIEELTCYLEKVNAGANGTVLQTREDAFSRLQDQLYKTVTTLSCTREAAVAAKQNFAENLENIAHQLKTPITAAGLSLELLGKEGGIYAGQIQKQLERLGNLEESLLTLAKVDAGVLPLKREAVDLYTVLNLAADNLRDLLTEKEMTVSIPDRGPAEMTGDLEWTMEALMNLLKNCMEHGPRGSVIHCDYGENPLYGEIRIWDEGPGFCPEDMPHLFTRFYRGREAVGNGVGIGLPLAQSIFELQNGVITPKNLPGGGACFEIRVYRH